MRWLPASTAAPLVPCSPCFISMPLLSSYDIHEATQVPQITRSQTTFFPVDKVKAKRPDFSWVTLAKCASDTCHIDVSPLRAPWNDPIALRNGPWSVPFIELIDLSELPSLMFPAGDTALRMMWLVLSLLTLSPLILWLFANIAPMERASKMRLLHASRIVPLWCSHFAVH